MHIVCIGILGEKEKEKSVMLMGLHTSPIR